MALEVPSAPQPTAVPATPDNNKSSMLTFASPLHRLRWFRNLPLGRRLSLLAVMLAAITLSAVVYIALISTSLTLRQETTAALNRQNTSIGSTIDRQLTYISLMLQDRIVPSVSRLYEPDMAITELRGAVDDVTRLERNLLFERVVLYIPGQSLKVFNFFNMASGADMMSRSVNTAEVTEEDWFVRAYEARQTGWIGPERYTPLSGATDIVAVVVPFPDANGDQIGLMWAEISTTTVAKVIRESISVEGGISSNAPGYAFLIGKDNRILATFNTRSHADELAPLVSLLPASGVYDLNDLAFEDQNGFAIVSPMSNTTWRLVSVLPDSVLPALPYGTVMQIVLISIVGLVAMVLSINGLVSREVSRPAWTLNTFADQIGSGVLATPIPLELQAKGDEIGSIARAMEDMRSRLAALYETLEQRVQERTAELEIARCDSEAIAEDLQAIYDESLLVVSDYHLQSILHNFVRRILSLLEADFCTVWLLRSNGEELRLVAHSDPGPPPDNIFVAIGDGMTGTVAQTGRPLRLAQYSLYGKRLNFEADSMERALCVPMLSSGQIIGAVVIGRPVEAEAFTENDQRMLTLFANLVSPAVRNAQLFVQLEEAHRRIDRANQVKTRFLASVTHELRTPLNFIINNLDFMRIGSFGDLNDEQVGRLDQTIRSAEHLLYLINDLLDVSKIEAGEMQMFIQNSDVYTILEDALDAAQMLLEKNEDKRSRIQFTASIPPGIPTIPMDARRIRQVLHNLLSNAIKFTDAGSVELRVEQFTDQKSRPWVRFAVHDTGIGIPDDEREAMFEAFSRTQNAKHAAIEGTGLGLPISRFLVQEHGGEMDYESTLGVGTTFWFTLPMFQSKADTRPVITQIMRALSGPPEIATSEQASV